MNVLYKKQLLFMDLVNPVYLFLSAIIGKVVQFLAQNVSFSTWIKDRMWECGSGNVGRVFWKCPTDRMYSNEKNIKIWCSYIVLCFIFVILQMFSCCKKTITQKWGWADLPTLDQWTQIVEEIYLMEKLKHWETVRNPNGEKAGEMDIIPNEESDTVD